MRLWVDAVCINQLDINEVNAQLAIACDIYKRANMTWVWLGENHDGGECCLQAISNVVSSGSCRVIRSDNYDVRKQFGSRTVMALVGLRAFERVRQSANYQGLSSRNGVHGFL
jgi:hypothetical protein